MTDKESSEYRMGLFSLKTILSINQLRNDASATNIRKAVSEKVGREVAVGQIYLTLGNLVKRNFIYFRCSLPQPVRGGRAKKIFFLMEKGKQVLAQLQ